MNKSLLIRLLVVGLLMTPLQASVTPSFVSEAIPTPSSCMFCESYATGAGRPDYAY